MKIEEQKVLVVGTGISGIAAAELLQSKNVDTVLFDGNKELDVNKLYEKAPKLKEMPIILGELTEEQMHEFGVAVLSPGVPTDLPMVERLRAQNVAIWGEIELAYYFGKGRLIAITGTNGKTTTTALTGAIMKNYYKDVRIVGNIGIPYTSEVSLIQILIKMFRENQYRLHRSLRELFHRHGFIHIMHPADAFGALHGRCQTC